jgi:hypothetical protein
MWGGSSSIYLGFGVPTACAFSGGPIGRTTSSDHRNDQEINGAYQQYGERQSHPEDPEVKVLRGSADTDGMRNPPYDQSGTQRVNEQRVCCRGFNKKDEQQSDWHVFGAVRLYPHGSEHVGIFFVPKGYAQATAKANGSYAEIYEEKSEQRCVNRDDRHDE